jgi:hypothetical protein
MGIVKCFIADVVDAAGLLMLAHPQATFFVLLLVYCTVCWVPGEFFFGFFEGETGRLCRIATKADKTSQRGSG